MNGKKIILLGVIALIVIGFVIAAGCTSTQSQTESKPTAGGTDIIDKQDKIAGTWTGKDPDGNLGTLILKDDMNGTMTLTRGDTGEKNTRSLIWVLSSTGKYILIQYPDDKEVSFQFNLSDDGKSFTSVDGTTTFTRA